MDADTEMAESEDGLDTDTDEEKMRDILTTTTKEIKKAASKLQVKDYMYNLNNTYFVL